MNKIVLIGNLTRDPEMRTTSTGVNVCSFGLAVRKRRSSQTQAADQPDADFFNVTAWRQLGELCQKYLAKGRRVGVTGSIALHTYVGKDGTNKASLEVTADDIEFLTSRSEDAAMGVSMPAAAPASSAPSASSSFSRAEEDELPF